MADGTSSRQHRQSAQCFGPCSAKLAIIVCGGLQHAPATRYPPVALLVCLLPAGWPCPACSQHSAHNIIFAKIKAYKSITELSAQLGDDGGHTGGTKRRWMDSLVACWLNMSRSVACGPCATVKACKPLQRNSHRSARHHACTIMHHSLAQPERRAQHGGCWLLAWPRPFGARILHVVFSIHLSSMN